MRVKDQTLTVSSSGLQYFPFFIMTNTCHRSLFSNSISFALSFSASLTPSLTHTHMQDSLRPEEPLSITQSGSQVNLLSCQMCRIGLLSGVKSPHYGPKAKLRKWMKLTPSLFPHPHDLYLCSLCPSTSPSPIPSTSGQLLATLA